ncbi:MAG: hypothetical protein FJW37_00105 [Acidobacteria bacterium]|nr:hypothetical protein [Acidobacteriota bacterium]
MRRFLILAALTLPLPAADLISSALGVTRNQTPIRSLLSRDDLDYHTPKIRVLLIGDSPSTAESALAASRAFERSRYRRRFALSVVPNADPDSTGGARGGYPPQGEFYTGPRPEGQYLWRWIAMHAPDLVLELREGPVQGWLAPPAAGVAKLAAALGAGRLAAPPDELVPRISGLVPALRLELRQQARVDFLETLFRAIERAGFRGPSPARREIQQRLDRTPLQVAEQLARRYGHDLDQVMYIPALALIGRLRLGHLADVERIVAPYSTGARPPLDKPTGSHLSGHLIFGELARATGKPRYLELARAAADLADLPPHFEMSDSVFMRCPLFAQVGRLTGDARYYDLSLEHMRTMLELNLRRDGLHRHSPLDETAWGRGNGFPALGLALSLTEIPPAHPGREQMLEAFRAHVQALAPHQDPTGAWHQVIDFPASYRELTATAMIGFAMKRGVSSGWLEKGVYERLIDRAWGAVRARIATDGSLVDVCAGTGKQKSLRDYLDRPAILGPDPRGGAMALLFATEMAGLRSRR